MEVIPGSKKFSVVGVNEWTGNLKIRVENLPVKGKANNEIEKKLTEFFEAKVKILKGEKTGKKLIEIDLPEEKVFEKISKSH
ncbi:MAG: YggU family protein [Candidatus Diapherotrites archaeon]|nr:YggU family protein [Candidatus Diapherotrites archaeon]